MSIEPTPSITIGCSGFGLPAWWGRWWGRTGQGDAAPENRRSRHSAARRRTCAAQVARVRLGMPVNDDVRLISNVLPTAVLGLRAPQQWTQPTARLEDLLGLPRRTMQHVQGAKQSFVPSPTDVHSPTAATRRKPTTDQRRNVPSVDSCTAAKDARELRAFIRSPR